MIPPLNFCLSSRKSAGAWIFVSHSHRDLEKVRRIRNEIDLSQDLHTELPKLVRLSKCATRLNATVARQSAIALTISQACKGWLESRIA